MKKDNSLIIFRADASLQIGTGHVMRCLTLGEELQKQGHDVHFICRGLQGNLCEFIADKGFSIHQLPVATGQETHAYAGDSDYSKWLGGSWQEDAKETQEVLARLPQKPDWIIVDHYALDTKWHGYLRSLVNHIMVIDDIANRPHDCDLLLDQNYNDCQRYNHLVPSHCLKLLGPKYALLRPEFSDYRNNERDKVHPSETPKVPQRILVNFGGIDLMNETAKAVNALTSISGIEVDILVSSKNPHIQSLRDSIKDLERFHLHVQINNVAELLSTADICIGAIGSSVWERLCLGVTNVVISIAENQKIVAEPLAKDGYIIYLGETSHVTEKKITDITLGLLQTHHLLNFLGQRGETLVDGRGAARVCRRMNHFRPLIIREATLEDCDPMFTWRNDATIRRFANDSDPLELNSHRAWFQKTLANPNRKLLVAEQLSKAVGVVRFDVKETLQEAEISIYLTPDYLGKGMGLPLLKAAENWLKIHEPQVEIINATVLPNNYASMELFTQNNYLQAKTTFRKSI